ncbi:MAG: succinylglutamate desuccinylase/aspartoacylase family protein, partial [Alphaproteobacteria bacterium]|nr:succinylglutamate desuccinylase/aspartoacylase family protein [Alphaproteobacteria bacterium]
VLHRYGKRGAAPKAYIQASLHANELPAMLVAHHLIALLDAADAAGRIRGEILIVPVANPIGLDQVIDDVHLGRYELSGGQNFNRGFDDHAAEAAERLAGRLGADAAANVALIRRTLVEIATAHAPSSELESLRRHLIRNAIDADFVLDLHSADEALMHLYFGAARWPDGADLSAEIGSLATLLAAESGGDPFDEVFGNIWAKLRRLLGATHPIPDACMSATIEYRGHGDVSDALAAADAAALLRFLTRRGLLAGEAGPLPAARCEASPLTAVETLYAPAAGILVYKAELGARIDAGEVVAEIIDPLAADPAQARCPVEAAGGGLFYQRKRLRHIRPGQAFARIAGTRPLPIRTGRLLEP